MNARWLVLLALVPAACGDSAATTFDAAHGGDGATADVPADLPDTGPPDATWADAAPGSQVVMDLDFPQGVIGDADAVYWTEAGTQAVIGTVKRMDKTTGVITTLASAQDGPQGIAVDDTHVYWTNFGEVTGGGSVRRVPKLGGTIQSVWSGGQLGGWVELDDTHVYFTSWVSPVTPSATGGVRRVAKSDVPGGLVQIVATDQWASGLALDGDTVWFTSMTASGAIRSVAKTGGTVTTGATAQSFPIAVAADGNDVYWTNRGPFDAPTGTLMRLDVGTPGNTPVQVAELVHPVGVKLTATHVYLAVLGTFSDITSSGELGRIGRWAGAEFHTLDGMLNKPIWLWLDGDQVWFVVGGEYSRSSGELRVWSP